MPKQRPQRVDESAEKAVENLADGTVADAGDPRGNNHRRQPQQKLFSDFSTASDDEFRRILRHHLEQNPLSKDYPDLFEKAPDCFVKWRQRFSASNPKLWKRLFTMDRVLKEFFEAVPVLDAIAKMIDSDTRLQQQQQPPNNDGTPQQQQQQHQTYTIIDLCSGKGYLGMILSEILPPSKVFRIVLMDKAWPMRNSSVKPQHINWEHIYGTHSAESSTTFCREIAPSQADETTEGDNDNDNNDDNDNDNDNDDNNDNNNDNNDSSVEAKKPLQPTRSYYDTWPIPIDTSKQDLKSSRQLELIRTHYLSNPSEHPVILLAIHLCGTLSLRAIDLFNTNPSIKFLALKPCCLPGMIHAKRKEIFRIGTHTFDASEVCVHGKWKKNKWEKGPPRSHLRPKFQKWSEHLYKGIGWGNNNNKTKNNNDDASSHQHREEVPFHGTAAAAAAATNANASDGPASPPTTHHEIQGDEDEIRKVHARICVQHAGGFQNDFLFAERTPISSATVWHGLDQWSTADAPPMR